MVIKLLSDLHLEFYTDRGKGLISTIPSEGVDVLILAGDITVVKDTAIEMAMLQRFVDQGFKKIIRVAGNHECYESSIDEVRSRMRTAAALIPGVYLLEAGKVLLLDGQRFLGDTGWFPFDVKGSSAQMGMTDFHVISGFVPAVYKAHENLRQFLSQELTEGDILITHHLSSWKSVAPEYKGSPLNRFFVADFEKLIKTRKPKLALHGHTHTPCDYTLGKTRVVCKPRGYPGSQQIKSWDSNFTIKI